MDHLLILWIALGIVFTVVEIATSQIVTIWFAVGSVGAIIANVLNASLTTQLIVFIAVSLLTLLIARPYLKKFTKTQIQPTNADMCIGTEALVTEEINNTVGIGQVKARGVMWTARSSDDSIIPAGSLVTIESIQGVKLIVREKERIEAYH